MALQTKGEGQGCRSLPSTDSRLQLAAGPSFTSGSRHTPSPAFDHRFVGGFWVAGEVGSLLMSKEWRGCYMSRELLLAGGSEL